MSMNSRALAQHLAWCNLTSDERIQAGRDWYTTRNRHPQTVAAPDWTERAKVKHRAKVKRSVALLIAMQADPADDPRHDVAALQAELETTREEMGRLRLRADLGTQLAEAQSETYRITALLTTDARFSEADTAPLRLPRRREAS